MHYTFHSKQWLPCPVEQVFAFLASPQNLPLLMPSWQQARISHASIVFPSDPPTAAAPLSRMAAGTGSRVTLSFRPFPYSPVRVHWLAEISSFTWNQSFCDRQIRGPFTFWNHCHSVREEVESGVPGTLICDNVQYGVPFGPAGRLAHSLLLRRQIERTFAFRQRQMARLLSRGSDR